MCVGPCIMNVLILFNVMECMRRNWAKKVGMSVLFVSKNVFIHCRFGR